MDENPRTEPTETTGEPQASFSTLVITLAVNAMQQLGAVRESENAPPLPANPKEAKPLIDALEILKVKTTGNLTPEEAELLDAVLTDLRLRYLKALNPPAPASTILDPTGQPAGEGIIIGA